MKLSNIIDVRILPAKRRKESNEGKRTGNSSLEYCYKFTFRLDKKRFSARGFQEAMQGTMNLNPDGKKYKYQHFAVQNWCNISPYVHNVHFKTRHTIPAICALGALTTAQYMGYRHSTFIPTVYKLTQPWDGTLGT